MHKFKDFFNKHESKLSSLTLISGFIFDYLTLQRVDFLWDNFLIILYLILAGAIIILVDVYEDDLNRSGFIKNIYEFLPFLLQFCFGGLFSAFTIFYSKSSSFISSGIFVFILFILMVGNEFFKKRYEKLVFRVGIYFVAVFSFSIYFLPVLTRQMGTLIFIGSGALSLIFISIFIFIISYLIPERYKENNKSLILTVLGLYISINILYFTNIIPPIPLSLKTGEVYHLVEKRMGGGYIVMGENKSQWYEQWGLKRKIHLNYGEPAYVFSSVFAPTDLNIIIIHDWQYFDEAKDEWISSNKISFPIKGGRDEGYRGFSKKESVFPGKWRVDIKTERGQVIGRVRFDIEMGNPPPDLETKII